MSLLDKIKLAAESAKTIATNMVEGNDLSVSDEVAQNRVAICESCPLLKKIGALKMCSECGCSVSLKTKLAGMVCPKGHW